MNNIRITLKHGDSIELNDDSEMSREQLSETLSTLFSLNTVAIIKTNNNSVIIRPSDISSIQIEELYLPENEPKKDIEVKEPKKSIEDVDMITDVN